MSEENHLNTVTIPSDPKVRAEIRASLRDISNLKSLVKSAQDTVKDAIKGAAEKFEIPKPYYDRMATMYHNGNFEKAQSEADDFFTLYEAIVETAK